MIRSVIGLPTEYKTLAELEADLSCTNKSSSTSAAHSTAPRVAPPAHDVTQRTSEPGGPPTDRAPAAPRVAPPAHDVTQRASEPGGPPTDRAPAKKPQELSAFNKLVGMLQVCQSYLWYFYLTFLLLFCYFSCVSAM